MNRIGLVQLSNSARNSPFGAEKAAFEKTAANIKGGAPEPLKLHKSFKPVTPSPLSANSGVITPTSAKFDVFSEEDVKENVETQTVFETHSTCTQTHITVPHLQPTITAEDLTSAQPTVNYYRVLADRLQMDYEDEEERNLRLVAELGDLAEQETKLDDDMEILLEVLADIDEEQMHDGHDDDDDETEIGVAHV